MTATSVSYRSEGDYTTVFQAKGKTLSDVKVEDVTVSYEVADSKDPEKVTEKKVEVTSVEPQGEKLSVSFQDSAASKNQTDYYTLSIKKKDAGSDIEVVKSDYELKPNVEYVLANAKEVRLTLELQKGEYAKDISKDNISLGASFEKMKIESFSVAGKNLTMQLTGKLTKNQSAGVYLDGA